jgi:hypothetical protein
LSAEFKVGMMERRTRKQSSLKTIYGFAALLSLLIFSASVALPAQEKGRLRRLVDDSRQDSRYGAHPRGPAHKLSSPAPAFEMAAGSALADAMNWLEANQAASGSWGTTFEYPDTTTVVESLGNSQPAGQPFSDGSGWLAGHAAGDNEELARQILALDYVQGLNIDAEIEDLLAARTPAETNPALPNYPEGGWGLSSGFETDNLTTALALQALQATGRKAGIGVDNESLAASTTNVHTWEIAADATKVLIRLTLTGSDVRLRMTQGSPPTLADPFFTLPAPGTFSIIFPDSGIPFTPGTNYISIESPDPPGLAATYSFVASYETPTFDTRAFAEALDYLRRSQELDGGWGIQIGEASSLYTTLHVMPALMQYQDYDFDAELASANAYLLGEQLIDGSFGVGGIGIDYMTALAALNLIRFEVCPFSTATEDAVAILLLQQQLNGSWSDESFDTGLALRALWEYDNDGDGVFQDGDCSGVVGDNVCAPGMSAGCDDVCVDYANPGQADVVFGQTISPPDENSITWTNPAEVAFVKGDLAGIDTYQVISGGAVSGATSISTFGDMPAPGDGFWYLVRPAGDCSTLSWQSSPGAEPGRDAASLGEITVTITSPADGAVIVGSPVAVSGTVTGADPITVTVNGVPAPVSLGSFAASVALTRGANVITADGEDAAGFTGSDTINLTMVDYSIAGGGSVVDSRIFTAASSVLDQIAFFTENKIGVPAGVTYTTQGVSRISATEIQVTFQIAVAGGTTPGFYFFQVEYGLLDAGTNPLGPLTGNTFDFQIEVTP